MHCLIDGLRSPLLIALILLGGKAASFIDGYGDSDLVTCPLRRKATHSHLTQSHGKPTDNVYWVETPLPYPR